MGKDQPEYLPLPSLIGVCDDVKVTNRWELTWGERLRVLFIGSIWIQQLSFGSVRPIRPLAEEPLPEDCR